LQALIFPGEEVSGQLWFSITGLANIPSYKDCNKITRTMPDIIRMSTETRHGETT
jgi:hypothetical protein